MNKEIIDKLQLIVEELKQELIQKPLPEQRVSRHIQSNESPR